MQIWKDYRLQKAELKKLKEKHVDQVLKKLVESTSMTEKTRKSLKPVGTRPVVMHDSCKVHKASVGNCPPF